MCAVHRTIERYMRRYVEVFKKPPLEGSKNYNMNVIVVIKLNIAEPNTVMLFIFKTLGMCASEKCLTKEI